MAIAYTDPRSQLTPGNYVVYWRANTWYSQGLDRPSEVRLMPVESPNNLASISPDGRQVAFVDANNQPAVYDLDIGKLVAYPNPDMKLITQFAWSPDSQVLLYSGYPGGLPFSDAPAAIYIIQLLHGNTQLLVGGDEYYVRGGNCPAWSPDGRWIAFISGRLTDYGIFLVDSRCIEDGQNCNEATKLIRENSYWSAPEWIFDENIVFTCSDGDLIGLCMSNVNAPRSSNALTNIPDLANFEVLDSILDPSTSPRNLYVAFTLEYTKPGIYNYFGDVYIQPLDGSKARNLTNTPEDDERFNGWSPDGQFIAFTRSYGFEPDSERGSVYHPIGDIFTVSVEGEEVVNLTNTPDKREDFAFWMAIPNQFESGGTYRITDTGNGLFLRASPSLNGAVMMRFTAGDVVTILEGPLQVDGYTWWKMRMAEGVEGWAVDVVGWYAPLIKPGD